eukprot:4792782-Amphidinium_carterae.1
MEFNQCMALLACHRGKWCASGVAASFAAFCPPAQKANPLESPHLPTVQSTREATEQPEQVTTRPHSGTQCTSLHCTANWRSLRRGCPFTDNRGSDKCFPQHFLGSLWMNEWTQ